MTILLAWLLADFMSGLVHWWEDRAIAGSSRFKFINGVRADNERHHKLPRYFLGLTWWQNINTTAPIAWSLAFVLLILGAPALMVLTLVFLSFGNLIHRFAHESKKDRPAIVSLLQYIGLFSSPSHHSGHHFKRGKLLAREDSKIRYCVMTNWLNPTLDKIKFFRLLERIIRL